MKKKCTHRITKAGAKKIVSQYLKITKDMANEIIDTQFKVVKNMNPDEFLKSVIDHIANCKEEDV